MGCRRRRRRMWMKGGCKVIRFARGEIVIHVWMLFHIIPPSVVDLVSCIDSYRIRLNQKSSSSLPSFPPFSSFSSAPLPIQSDPQPYVKTSKFSRVAPSKAHSTPQISSSRSSPPPTRPRSTSRPFSPSSHPYTAPSDSTAYPSSSQAVSYSY